MFIPIWLLVGVTLVLLIFAGWAIAASRGRNPLPFPDNGSRIFSAASPQAKEAIVEFLASHGIKERFQANSSGILRSILWDGTIINCPPHSTQSLLDGATSAIGLVSSWPEEDARRAVQFFAARGCKARIVENVEPELPIAFVVTDALPGTVINFRRHVLRMPRPRR